MTHQRKIRQSWSQWADMPTHPGLVAVGTQKPMRYQTTFRKRSIVLISDFQRPRPVSYFDPRGDKTSERAWHFVFLNFEGASPGVPYGPGGFHAGAPGNMGVFSERLIQRFFRPQGHISERLLMKGDFWERLHAELYPPMKPPLDPAPVLDTPSFFHYHGGTRVDLQQGGWMFVDSKPTTRWICPECKQIVLSPRDAAREAEMLQLKRDA